MERWGFLQEQLSSLIAEAPDISDFLFLERTYNRNVSEKGNANKSTKASS